ncbi:5189_t:CDS:10 [Entrophospora sp. SA101]|nr:5189_t:CDS:10 [Entrophospora sp. SA101]
MNPVDHPHGGGEGKASIGRKSPLKKKCEKANQAGKVITLKVYKRGTVISDKMVGHNFLIHNGKNFNSLQPTSEHIGYRFGEFAPTRRVGKHGKAAISPQKLRPVANLVRRKEIDYSLNTLHFLPHKGARILHKILQGAIKQIKKRDKKEKAVFYISQIRVDQGSIRKKMIFRAKGSANTLRQTTSHLFLCLSPKEANKLIRDYLFSRFPVITQIKIERTKAELFVFVYSPNISLITGEDNDNLDQILTKITNIVNEKKIITKLYLNEERKIYSSAQAIANDLAPGEKDIRGIKVRVGGCLEKGGIAQHKTISQGRMPSNTLDSLIKEAKTEANTIYGQIGIVAVRKVIVRFTRKVAVVKTGTIMFELSGINREAAYQALHAASYKLPIKCKVIEKNLTKAKIRAKAVSTSPNSPWVISPTAKLDYGEALSTKTSVQAQARTGAINKTEHNKYQNYKYFTNEAKKTAKELITKLIRKEQIKIEDLKISSLTVESDLENYLLN